MEGYSTIILNNLTAYDIECAKNFSDSIIVISISYYLCAIHIYQLFITFTQHQTYFYSRLKQEDSGEDDQTEQKNEQDDPESSFKPRPSPVCQHTN